MSASIGFASAVKHAGDDYAHLLGAQRGHVAIQDHLRESARFKTMVGHRVAGQLNLCGYVEHVLPVSTGHRP